MDNHKLCTFNYDALVLDKYEYINNTRCRREVVRNCINRLSLPKNCCARRISSKDKKDDVNDENIKSAKTDDHPKTSTIKSIFNYASSLIFGERSVAVRERIMKGEMLNSDDLLHVIDSAATFVPGGLIIKGISNGVRYAKNIHDKYKKGELNVKTFVMTTLSATKDAIINVGFNKLAKGFKVVKKLNILTPLINFTENNPVGKVIKTGFTAGIGGITNLLAGAKTKVSQWTDKLINYSEENTSKRLSDIEPGKKTSQESFISKAVGGIKSGLASLFLGAAESKCQDKLDNSMKTGEGVTFRDSISNWGRSLLKKFITNTKNAAEKEMESTSVKKTDNREEEVIGGASVLVNKGLEMLKSSSNAIFTQSEQPFKERVTIVVSAVANSVTSAVSSIFSGVRKVFSWW